MQGWDRTSLSHRVLFSGSELIGQTWVWTWTHKACLQEVSLMNIHSNSRRVILARVLTRTCSRRVVLGYQRQAMACRGPLTWTRCPNAETISVPCVSARFAKWLTSKFLQLLTTIVTNVASLCVKNVVSTKFSLVRRTLRNTEFAIGVTLKLRTSLLSTFTRACCKQRSHLWRGWKLDAVWLRRVLITLRLKVNL